MSHGLWPIVPKKRKKKPFRALAVIEDICVKRGYNPAEKLIHADARLTALLESSADPLPALKVQVEIAKAMLNKIYANKQETVLKGDEAAPLSIDVRFVDAD